MPERDLSIDYKGNLMPKELTHLVLAAAIRKKFTASDRHAEIGQALKASNDAYLFGAVMHDLAFCAPSGPAGDKVKAKGMAIHGNPAGNTLTPLIRLAAEFDKTGSPEMLAMIAGAVSHMYADAVFHPFVYYYTGDEIERHYRLEAIIDTYFYKKQKHWLDTPVSPLSLYKNVDSDMLVIYLARFLNLSDTLKPVLKKALRMHWFVLRLFRSRIGYCFFWAVSQFSTAEFKSKRKLFYPAGMTFDAPFFEDDFFYRHPVTGEERKDGLESLTETVICKTCSVLHDISLAAGKREVEKYFSELSPISLETGLDVSVPRVFKYTDLSLTIDLLLHP